MKDADGILLLFLLLPNTWCRHRLGGSLLACESKHLIKVEGIMTGARARARFTNTLPNTQ